ncbi:YaaR family protein [Geobacter sp. DSM 9736]|uniref:YaaR family protein n=1 Tax=Geobacter sp. DSM 9736 TaxID=1277350 RepID=UPI000B507074|nr:YaaR family protein [Geobacter sp. DSM 9736]SNB47087.1 hypothetical protein SAMN06269301_2561 [Geobacter sp. DSM 9736]
MRINDNLPSTEVEKKKKTKASSRGADNAGSLFATRLSARVAELQDVGLELHELKEEIDRAAVTLDREPTVANFRAFRDLLSSFAKKASSQAYRVERVRSSGITPHEHELVAVIDREADELYRLIVSEQKDRIAITGKIVRIKGIVVNFLT